ncbi:MAG TPA: thioredoxin [Phycisphaerales bacterium]|nr:thioredoxin [Phycisphaerales bacterium]
MANAHVKEFTDANFDSEVLASDKPVMVDFWAEWCQPCRTLAPTIDALATEYDGKAKVGKVNIDHNHGTGAKYQISSIPTVLIFKGGTVVKKFVGFQKKEVLVAALEDAGR